MKCYVMLRIFEELYAGKAISKEECMQEFNLSTSTFMRYVRNLRDYCEQRKLGRLAYCGKTKTYRLEAFQNETE